MGLERRGLFIAVAYLGQPVRWEEPFVQRKRQPSCGVARAG